MKDIDKLESYIASPLDSTIFVVGYKGKALDKRSKLAKLIQSKSVYFLSAKIKDGKIQEWIHELIHSKGLEIKTKAAALLEEHIGNDLSRIANEIDKLSLNLNGKKDIDEDDIEKFIGISKEYNVFELQAAISRKDAVQALRIIQYFESNPKAVPIQMALPALYANFSKIYSVYGMPDKSDTALKPVFYFNASALAQAKETMKRYGYPGIERILLLLHEYNLRSIGIGHGADSGPALMREMVVKMMM
jgi:DNA polymerase-3 subunit delta